MNDIEYVVRASVKSQLSKLSENSNRSKKSSSSSHSSHKIVEEKAELAALKVRRRLASEKGVVEQLEKIDEEIAVREAKIEVYESYIDPIQEGQSVNSQNVDISLKSKVSEHCYKGKDSSNVDNILHHTITSYNDRAQIIPPPLSFINERRHNTNKNIQVSDHSNRDVDYHLTTEKVCEVLHMQNFPKVDLETFNGDPLEFNFF